MQFYIMQANGERRYFKENQINEANAFAQSEANARKQTVVRYDTYGGQSWFRPQTK